MVTTTRALIGHQAEAFGADPSDVDRTYKFRYKVVALDDLIPSHTDSLAVNPRYPGELQPRIRERAASRIQIEAMAQNLNPKVLLRDTGFLDVGPMIVGSDDVVESGNGRVLALRKAVQDYPAKYRLYRQMLVNQAASYGLDEDAVEGINTPVLVRERVTPVDRVKFAAEANTSNVLAMSPFEQAVQDAGRLPAATIQTIEVGEDESIDQALRRKANAPIVAKFYESIPANERASIVDSKGEITAAGLNRLKLAIFTKTYQGNAGQRLARTFSESLDPAVKNMENAMFQSLPDMAKAEALITSGARDKDLSIAPDLAEVIDAYAALKQTGTRVDDYLAQSEMFERRLSPMQKAILSHLDSEGRSPKKIREFIRDVAGQVVAAPGAGQVGGMFGGEYELTKEKLVYGSINKQRKEAGKEPIEATSGARGKGLEESDAERSKGADSVPGRLPEPSRIQPAAAAQTPELAPSTSVQVGLSGLGKESAQVQMFGEVSGKESHKDTLIDVDKEKAREAAKPLPGQTELLATKPPETTTTTREPGKAPRKRSGDVLGSKKAPSNAVEVPTVSETRIREAMDNRKPQSQALDLAQQHRTVVPTSSPRVLRWLKDPGTMDVRDIDTLRARAAMARPKTRTEPRPKAPRAMPSRPSRDIFAHGGTLSHKAKGRRISRRGLLR